MKKKILLLVIGILLISGCSDLGPKSKTVIDNSFVKMEIAELDINNAKIVLKNMTDDNYTYGESFFIEKGVDDNWYNIKTIGDAAFTLQAYTLKPDEEVELDIDWKEYYGNLSEGRYRIVKDVFKEQDGPVGSDETVYIAAEFIVE